MVRPNRTATRTYRRNRTRTVGADRVAIVAAARSRRRRRRWYLAVSFANVCRPVVPRVASFTAIPPSPSSAACRIFRDLRSFGFLFFFFSPPVISVIDDGRRKRTPDGIFPGFFSLRLAATEPRLSAAGDAPRRRFGFPAKSTGRNARMHARPPRRGQHVTTRRT